MTTRTPPERFEDRLLDQLKLAIAENQPPGKPSRRRRRTTRQTRRRAGLAGVPLALAAAALVIVPSLNGPRTGIAEAAVLARAAQALDQPNTILYAQVDAYSAHSLTCILASECFGGGAGASDGISADPAEDTLSYSEQEWLSPDRNVQRELFNNGDETVANADSNVYEAYNAATNTVTTLTQFEDGSPRPLSSPTQVAPMPALRDIANPSYYQALYHEAQAGKQDAQLVGQTTIDGTSVYELRFTIDPKPPTNPPPGDMCGSSVCVPPGQIIDLYLDSQTFTPVRTVAILSNPTDQPGIPDGSSVSSVVDFSAQSLPDTAANEQLLQMSAHPSATETTETVSQYRATVVAALQAQVAAARARTAAAK